jgi:hypothetical protein
MKIWSIFRYRLCSAAIFWKHSIAGAHQVLFPAYEYDEVLALVRRWSTGRATLEDKAHGLLEFFIYFKLRISAKGGYPVVWLSHSHQA